MASRASALSRAVHRLANTDGALMASAPGYAVLFLLHLRNSLPSLAGGRVPPDLGYGPGASPTLQILQVVCLAYLFAVYGAMLRRARTAPPNRRRLAWSVVGLAVLAVALLPANSSDVLEYLGFGRLLAIYRLNPYVHTYGEITDRFAGLVTWNDPMPYGPLVLPIFAAAGWLTQRSVLLAIYGIKLVWLLVHLMNAWLIYRLAASLMLVPEYALFLFACNPLILIEQAGNGHNDGLLILCGLLALTALMRGRTALGVCLAFLGALVKTPGVFLLAGIGALAIRRRDWRGLIVGIGASLTGLAAMVILIRGSLSALTVMDMQWRYSEDSLHTILIEGLRAVTNAWTYTDIFRADRLIGAVAFVAWGVWRLTLIGDVPDLVREVGHMLVVLLLAFAASVSPWYATWLLPFAALTTSDRLRRTILMTTGSILALYAFPYRLVEQAPFHAVWSALRLVAAFGTPIGFWMVSVWAFRRQTARIALIGAASETVR